MAGRGEAGGTPGHTQHAYEARPGAARGSLPSGYRRRDPEATPLHQAVRQSLATFLAESAEEGGQPRFVERDFVGYLECGVLARGFARVRCRECGDEVLVGFSCKRRGVCPSCNARRAHDTAAHLVDRVLPVALYRQWTLSFPKRIRWHLARDVRLRRDVRHLFLRALFGWMHTRARALGFEGQSGAICFEQRFSSALQLNPHLHVLVPEGMFVGTAGDSAVKLFPLPPPGDNEVEALLLTVATRTVRLLKRRGLLDDAAIPQSAHDATLAASLQHRLPFPSRLREPPARQRRCAFLEGFSLHANTHVHPADRQGLELLCRYGARGAISLNRLSLREDGRLAYRMKRPAPDGSTHRVLTALELTRRLAALVPPPRVHLVHFAGVFAPGAKLRRQVIPAPPELPPPAPTASPDLTPGPARRKSRLDWAALLRRVFAVDVLLCPCGGQRQVLAFLTEVKVVAEILDPLQLPSKPLPWACAQGPPQRQWLD